MSEYDSLNKFLERAKSIKYGEFQRQFISLLQNLKAGTPLNLEKYTQLSPAAIEFLIQKAKYLPEEELSIICFYLFTSTKPSEQNDIIKKIEIILGENEEEIEKRIKEIKQSILVEVIVNQALEGAKNIRLWSILLEFYSNPENQKIRPDILELALEAVKNIRDWEEIISFYSNP